MRWSVGAKIGTAFALVILMLVLVGLQAYRTTETFVKAAELRRHTSEALRRVEMVLSSLKDAETGQRGFVITGEDRYLEPYRTAAASLDDEVAALRNSLTDNATQRNLLTALQKDIVVKMDELNKTIVLRREKGFAEAQQLVLTDAGKQSMDQARAAIEEIRKNEESMLMQRTEDADRLAAATIRVIRFGIAGVAALIFLIGIVVSRNIARPLREVTQVADRIALGDLSTKLQKVQRSDEVGTLRNAFFGMNHTLRAMAKRATQIAGGDLRGEVPALSEKDELGTAFARMTTDLRAFMREILEAVNVLASSATQIMASTSQLASGAAETATSVTQTTTTVEEVKQTAQVSNRKGKLVADSSQKAALVAQQGTSSVEKTIEGMTRIREQMQSIAESIVRLSEQSQAIGEIISVVDDLAAQSNLLAVNASIEAAKAGEHGKGFSVVAQEVKSLANQSREATTQVRGILTEIQKATSAAVMATEQGTKAVASGMGQSESAGEAIHVLNDSITEAAQAAMQIAATSHEQSIGMDQVALAMENIKVASSQTVASTKQVEIAAQNLHELGMKLRGLVARFKL